MPYHLGHHSLEQLRGVHPFMVSVVEHAITLTDQDFTVHDGLRTPEEQEVMLATGASRTRRSLHLPQPDGYGHAVDLVPFLNGKLRWEWPLIYPIVKAVRIVAKARSIRVRWGGAWDVYINDTSESPEEIVAAYVERRRALGKRAFIDGPHFDLGRD